MNDNHEAERIAKTLDAQTMPTVVSVNEDGVITVEEAKRPLNGRRLLRKELQARYRLIQINPNDTSRFVKMGSRKQRRAPLPATVLRRFGKSFRPVLAHAIPVTTDHKSVIRALKTMNRKTAAKYLASRQPKVEAEGGGRTCRSLERATSVTT